MTTNNKLKKSKAGRPSVTENELDTILHKLEPHLKTGKTLNKACLLAQIPKSTAYKYYGINTEFTEKIDASLAYISILISDNFFNKLVDITKRLNRERQLKKQLENKALTKAKFLQEMEILPVTEKDWDFLKWYALNSHTTRDEWGNRVEITGKDSKPVIPTELFEQKPMETVLKTYEIVRRRLKISNDDNRPI